jgi:hypothetical protein
MIKWCEQVGKSGCGLAISAMVLSTRDPNVTYARVVEMAPKWCHERCGLEDVQLDEFLAEHGWAVQRKWKVRDFDKQIKSKWPPKPWAELHICSVYQTKDDFLRGDGHYVVMDAKGLVYDPADPQYTKCRLSRYYDIEWVAAVIEVE